MLYEVITTRDIGEVTDDHHVGWLRADFGLSQTLWTSRVAHINDVQASSASVLGDNIRGIAPHCDAPGKSTCAIFTRPLWGGGIRNVDNLQAGITP